jgi:hypothetical protein
MSSATKSAVRQFLTNTVHRFQEGKSPKFGASNRDAGAIDREAMKNDPIVAEVRKWRQKYSAKFGHDLTAMCDDLHRNSERAKRAGRRVASPPPRRSTNKKAV